MLASYALRQRGNGSGRSGRASSRVVATMPQELPQSRHVSDLTSCVDLMIVAQKEPISQSLMQSMIERSGVREIFTFPDEWVNPIRKAFPYVNVETTVEEACPRVNPKIWGDEAFDARIRDLSGWMVLSAASRRVGHTLTFQEHAETLRAVLRGRDTPLIKKLRRGLCNVNVAFLHDAEHPNDPDWMGWFILDWLLAEPHRRTRSAARLHASQEKQILMMMVVMLFFVAAAFRWHTSPAPRVDRE